MGCGPSSPLPAQPCGEKPQQPSAESRILRGQMFSQNGQLDEALREFNIVIETWPFTARAYLERGTVSFQRKQWEDAKNDFSAAIGCQSDYMMAYIMRAQVHFELKHLEEAMMDCVEAARLDGDNSQVKALKASVQRARQTATLALAATTGKECDDPFLGIDSPVESTLGMAKLCMVCMDNERGCRLHPCLHAALCVSCTLDLKSRGYGCPICSAPVEDYEAGQFMRTYTIEEAPG